MNLNEHIWQEGMTWNRKCPKCENVISHTGLYARSKALGANRIGRKCRSCSQTIRKPISEITRQRMSVAQKNRIGRKIGWHQSEASKEKIRKANKNRPITDATKTKLRLKAIAQHQANGIDFPAVDKGARDCFQFLNMFYGLNIQYPNYYLKDLGYFLDGYDPVSHSVYEFDSKHHLKSGVMEKDLIRQKEICEHFKSLNKPLNAFYRINATGVGEFCMKDILNN